MMNGAGQLRWPRATQGLGYGLLAGSMLLPWYAMWRQSHKEYRQPSAQSAPLRPVMLVLPTGKFLMGSPANEPDSSPDERPQHEVEIRQGFAISETEVTQEQYQAVMGSNPSYFKSRKKNWQQRPVEDVSWLDAVQYCNKLSVVEEKEPCYQIEGKDVTWAKGLACKGYRLPTEAEWEYAARAEDETTYAGSNREEDVGWFGEGTESSTHEVKGKKPNQWGLYDMSGNVSEWVWDKYSDAYEEGVQVDPSGPLLGGSSRVARGGSWSFGAGRLRVAARSGIDPDRRTDYRGFRLSRSYP